MSNWPQTPPLSGMLFDATIQALPEVERAETSKNVALKNTFIAAPFLAELASRFPNTVRQIRDHGVGDVVATLLSRTQKLAEVPETPEHVGKQLRLLRQELALCVALAEISGEWTTRRVTQALSDLADHAVEAALSVFLVTLVERGKFIKTVGDVTTKNCGLAVFALGKHGGQELNYSSDIDIVAFFDSHAEVLVDPDEATKIYSRLMQNVGNLLTDRDEFGYVFRTDLRLRPDPGSTPVALSVDAAMNYYESRGQNWERAAWSKARQCAGDTTIGAQFLKDMSPFVWRKHLDFATISDIQAMKRQINISKNVGGQRLAGHNVKLGRGGIREIEFFVQTQMLIAGGRDTNLRVRPTSSALGALAKAKWISEGTAAELKSTYWYLRAVENRVQMVADAQTHILPTDAEKLGHIASLMGCQDTLTFEQEYLAALECVSDNYSGLFEDESQLSSDDGNLVFTGTDDDPATLENLTQLGYENPELASATIRKWHYGGYSATRSAAARAHLTELVPVLLRAIGKARNADETLLKFDRFLEKFPAGVQLFAMLRTNIELCELIISLLAAAPKMADAIIRRVHVLDGLIDPSRSGEVIDAKTLKEKVDHFLGLARDYEDVIDRARIVGQEQKFLISAGLVSGSVSSEIAMRQFTVLAQTLIEKLFSSVRQKFEEVHGTLDGSDVGLVALGKLGSYEMTESSDLDLILVYDLENRDAVSNGVRPLEAAVYFSRLTQRLITALSVPTATGVLYEVDMRLRPSGNKGPVATSLASFIDYQTKQAWTWEHLALCRARPISASAEFERKLSDAIEQALVQPRDKVKALAAIVDMRQLMLRERPAKHPFDLKLLDGGLVDLDFIAQSAVLLLGDRLPDLVANRQNHALIFNSLEDAGYIKNSTRLAQVHQTMSAAIQIMSASLNEPLANNPWTPAFRAQLTRLLNEPDFDRLSASVREDAAFVASSRDNWFKTVGVALD